MHTHAVVVAFCRAKVQLSRLIGLSSYSIDFIGSRVGVANGKGGREVIPFNSRLGGALHRCLGLESTDIRTSSPTFFLSSGNREVRPTGIESVIEAGLTEIYSLGGGDPRILERSFTATVLGRRMKVRDLGGLLKRTGLSAARVCARAAFRRLGQICGVTRPETWPFWG